MNRTQQFFDRECRQTRDKIERMERSLQNPNDADILQFEHDALEQLQRQLTHLQAIAQRVNTLDEALGEVCVRLMIAEEAHHQTMHNGCTLTDAWWETLHDIQLMANLHLRLRQFANEQRRTIVI